MTKYIILEDFPLGKKGEEINGEDFPEMSIFFAQKLNVIAVKDERLRCTKCNAPFQKHHTIHTGSHVKGQYHTNCIPQSKDETPKRWRPEKDDRFWYITALGEVFSHEWNANLDEGLFAFGNVFKTKEEATAKALEIKKVLLAPVINEKK